MKRHAGPTCTFCGKPIERGRSCVDCPRQTVIASQSSWGEYDGVLRDVIHAWKFRRHDFLTPHLATLLADCWHRRDRPDIDAVVAVPSSRRRSRARGFDHADELASGLAKRISTRYSPRLIRRTTENQVQSLLPRSARPDNVRGIFEGSAQVSGATLLVVDDIETTGATLHAVALALRRAGAARVFSLTIARTP